MSCHDSLDEGPWAAMLVNLWPLDTRQWAAILVMIDYQWHAEGKTRIKLVVQQAVVSTQDGTEARWGSDAPVGGGRAMSAPTPSGTFKLRNCCGMW